MSAICNGSSGATSLRRFIGPKRATLLVLFILFACAAWYLRQRGLLTHEFIRHVAVEHPVLAPLLFMFIYAATVLFMIPSLPLNIGAGFLWGPLLGSVYALIGSTSGCMLAFLFARTAVGQPFARHFDNRLLDWLAAELSAKGGWRVVAFVRINPAFPCGPTNYLFGLTGLPLWTYAWGTVLFMYPLCLGFATLGHVVGDFTLDADWSRVVQVIIVVSGIVALAVLGRMLFRLRCGDVPGAGKDAS